MSKRILTEIGTNWRLVRNAMEDEGTNLDMIRVYESRIRHPGEMYAVIIADDNLFEGL